MFQTKVAYGVRRGTANIRTRGSTRTQPSGAAGGRAAGLRRPNIRGTPYGDFRQVD